MIVSKKIKKVSMIYILLLFIWLLVDLFHLRKHFFKKYYIILTLINTLNIFIKVFFLFFHKTFDIQNTLYFDRHFFDTFRLIRLTTLEGGGIFYFYYILYLFLQNEKIEILFKLLIVSLYKFRYFIIIINNRFIISCNYNW